MAAARSSRRSVCSSATRLTSFARSWTVLDRAQSTNVRCADATAAVTCSSVSVGTSLIRSPVRGSITAYWVISVLSSYEVVGPRGDTARGQPQTSLPHRGCREPTTRATPDRSNPIPPTAAKSLLQPTCNKDFDADKWRHGADAAGGPAHRGFRPDPLPP